VQENNEKLNAQEILFYRKRILAWYTTASWYLGNDYIKNLWNHISELKLWQTDIWIPEVLQTPFVEKGIYYIINPNILNSIKGKIVGIIKDKIDSGITIPKTIIGDIAINAMKKEYLENREFKLAIDTRYNPSDASDENSIFDKFYKEFFDKLYWDNNRRLQRLIFAQRLYINESFKEFNQIDVSDELNTPWDWDHIYPKNFIDSKTLGHFTHVIRHCTNVLGNLRAVDFSKNRSDGNRTTPADKYSDNSSILLELEKEEVVDLFKTITGRIDRMQEVQIKVIAFYKAVTFRSFGMYIDWYTSLEVEKVFP